MKENRKLLREVLKDIRHDMTEDELFTSTFLVLEQNTSNNQFKAAYNQYSANKQGDNFCFK